MHDTAFEIGSLALNIYADLRTDAILEVGAQSVNGSLRDNALATTKYVGLDIEPGAGVDLVIEPGKPFPVEHGAFDLVIASSVFEHDPSFWLTFVEMCRATKEGGYIYINAPSNGIVHRYPQDVWRFYPDAGKALAAWATAQGTPVSLVESFIADRGEFVWNDFVAVFRKGPITRPLPKVFLYEHVSCANIITWKSNEILNPKEFPQDIELLGEATQRIQTLEQGLTAAEQDRQSLLNQTTELTSRLTDSEQQQSETREVNASLQKALEVLESEMIAKEGEIARKQQAGLQAQQEISQLRKEVEAIRTASLANEERARKEKKRRQSAEVEGERVQSELEALEHLLQERFREIASLTTMLAEHQKADRRVRADVDWLRETGALLSRTPETWKGRLSGFLPSAFQAKRLRKLLKDKGLFNPDGYLAAHPDVARNGIDPLRHYLAHGIAEGRRRD